MSKDQEHWLSQRKDWKQPDHEESELQSCTFKPKTNKKYNSRATRTLYEFVNDQEKFSAKKVVKIDQMKENKEAMILDAFRCFHMRSQSVNNFDTKKYKTYEDQRQANLARIIMESM